MLLQSLPFRLDQKTHQADNPTFVSSQSHLVQCLTDTRSPLELAAQTNDRPPSLSRCLGIQCCSLGFGRFRLTHFCEGRLPCREWGRRCDVIQVLRKPGRSQIFLSLISATQ